MSYNRNGWGTVGAFSDRDVGDRVSLTFGAGFKEGIEEFAAKFGTERESECDRESECGWFGWFGGCFECNWFGWAFKELADVFGLSAWVLESTGAGGFFVEVSSFEEGDPERVVWVELWLAGKGLTPANCNTEGREVRVRVGGFGTANLTGEVFSSGSRVRML